MTPRRLWCGGGLALCAALLACSPLRALADVYRVVDLGSTYSDEMEGLSSSGDVLVHYFAGSSACIGQPVCWAVFSRSGAVAYFDTKPVLTYDYGSGGSSCGGLPGWVEDAAVNACDNGRVAFTLADNYQLWTGPDPAGGTASTSDLTLLYNGEVMPVFLNGEGDVAFGTLHENYVAYDLGPTAEPGSLVLLGTGMLASVALLWRRLERC